MTKAPKKKSKGMSYRGARDLTITVNCRWRGAVLLLLPSSALYNR